MGEWSKSRWIDVLVFAADILIIIFSCYLTQVLTYTIADKSIDRSFYVVYTLLSVFMLYAYDMYFSRETRRADTMMAVFISMAVAGVGTFFAEWFLGFDNKSIIPYFIAFAVSAVILSAEKLLYSKVLKNIKGQQSILIIDSLYSRSRLARKVKYSCNDLQSAWYILINDGEDEDIERAVSMIDGNDCVFISPALSPKASRRIFTEAVMTGKCIYQIPTLDRVATVGGKIVQFGDTPAVEVNSIGLTKLEKIVKRIFDIFASLVGFVIALPIMLVCAVAIKLDSKGPVFYKQERYTIHRKKFSVYKFRTMREDAEKFGAQLATEKDPRITRVGRVLRALRLDELPQILNILSGSMSIVGPRPERPVFADEYGKNVEYYNTRYAVKAGLTGYAQVYGKYNTRVSDKILMDMVYITQYSFWLDIKLILLTIKVMFTKESTEGVDEERDRELNADEKEYERIVGGWSNEQ